MKILDKLQINVAKSAERKLEVEEGRKLASSVDGLRELKAKEESSLGRFRDKAIEAVKAEIQIFIDRRDAVLEELRVVSQQVAASREEAKTIFDGIDEKEAEADRRVAKAKAAEVEADKKNREASQKLLDAGVALARANLLDDESGRLRDEASKDRKEANKELREAQAKGAAARDMWQSTNDDLVRREGAAAHREKALLLREQAVADADASMSARERAVIDREEQLAREIKRAA